MSMRSVGFADVKQEKLDTMSQITSNKLIIFMRLTMLTLQQIIVVFRADPFVRNVTES